MFITSSLPATSASRPKNGMCLSLESGGSANVASPGTAVSMRVRRVAAGLGQVRPREARSDYHATRSAAHDG